MVSEEAAVPVVFRARGADGRRVGSKVGKMALRPSQYLGELQVEASKLLRSLPANHPARQAVVAGPDGEWADLPPRPIIATDVRL